MQITFDEAQIVMRDDDDKLGKFLDHSVESW